MLSTASSLFPQAMLLPGTTTDDQGNRGVWRELDESEAGKGIGIVLGSPLLPRSASTPSQPPSSSSTAWHDQHQPLPRPPRSSSLLPSQSSCDKRPSSSSTSSSPRIMVTDGRGNVSGDVTVDKRQPRLSPPSPKDISSSPRDSLNGPVNTSKHSPPHANDHTSRHSSRSSSASHLIQQPHSNSASSSSPQSMSRRSYRPSAASTSAPVVTSAQADVFDANQADASLAAHIRAVYAHLENVGVIDDGYAPGVERTRERRSRGNSLPPAIRQSLGNGLNDVVLDRREAEVLQKTDRYGFFEASHPITYGNGNMPRVTTLVAEALVKLPTLQIPPQSLFKSSNANLPPPAPSESTTPSIATDPDYFVPPPKSTSSELAPSSFEAPKAAQKELQRIDKWSLMMPHSNVESKGRSSFSSLFLTTSEPTFSQHQHQRPTSPPPSSTPSPSIQNSMFSLGREFRFGGSKHAQFRKRCYKGIPDRWRRVAWQVMMYDQHKQQQLQKHQQQNRLGRDLNHDEMKRAGYRQCKNTPSEHDVQIDLDVPRTISGHVLFHTRYGKGQRNLFYLLHCFSQLCKECGYCQGMGPIAATFLTYYEAEAAHAAMVRLHDVYGLHDIFKPEFPGLRRCFYVQQKLVEALMPDVHAVLKCQMVYPSAYATKWYITLFSNTVSFSSQLRLWDAFFVDGLDVLILASVSILWSFRTRLVMSSASFECILTLLSCFFIVEDEDVWMRWIRKVVSRSDVKQAMSNWKLEWDGFVKDGTANTIIT